MRSFFFVHFHHATINSMVRFVQENNSIIISSRKTKTTPTINIELKIKSEFLYHVLDATWFRNFDYIRFIMHFRIIILYSNEKTVFAVISCFDYAKRNKKKQQSNEIYISYTMQSYISIIYYFEANEDST